MDSLFQNTLSALVEKDIGSKIQQTRLCLEQWKADRLQSSEKTSVASIPQAGLPGDITLVTPRKLLKRKMSTAEGIAIFVHAIAHIEFNAINLALDAVYRFQDMPDQFFSDWLEVAVDEARHFELLQSYLHDLGWKYGDFPAHNGLWEMAVKTDRDLLARMGLVPRVLEARGIDVTPAMIRKFEGMGNQRMTEILKVILEEEVDHVRKGDYWFKWACKQKNVNPEEMFISLINKNVPGMIKGPFNVEARIRAGFSHEELASFENL